MWCEDSRSGYDFWTKVFATLYKEYIVESKKNNSELCKSVSKIKDEDDNRYYILMDNAIDNPTVLREVQRLHGLIRDKRNVSVIKVHSFEFVLLSFKMLESWVFAKEDELKEKRRELLEFRTSFIDIICNGGDKEKLAKLKETQNYSEVLNTEQISSKLLFDITRNTGFETSKGKLGDCFITDCCEWEGREADDICGLDDNRLSSADKIKTIVENSVLKDSFAEAGL